MPRDLVVLTNPVAGKGRAIAVRDAGVARLRAAGHRVRSVAGRDADEALDLARTAVADRVDALLVCGGDGLVSIALQAVAGSDVALGFLPAGTSNDTARSVGVPLGDAVAAAEHVLRWRPRAMDLARTGDRWFGTVLRAGVGLREPLHYQLDLDGRHVALEAVLVAVGNGPSFGGGLRIAEGAVLDDGLLDVVVIGPLSKPELVWTYPKLFKGTHVDHPSFQRHRVRRVTVASPGIVAYADGERLGPLPLTVECVPGAVTVLA